MKNKKTKKSKSHSNFFSKINSSLIDLTSRDDDIQKLMHELEFPARDDFSEQFVEQMMQHDFELPVKDENLHLYGNEKVQTLIVPNSFISVRGLVLRDMPNLECVVIKSPQSNLFPIQKSLLNLMGSTEDLFWIAIKNLPNLRNVEISGPVRSLEISGAPRMKTLQLDMTMLLERCALDDVRALSKINTVGAIKLRHIDGIEKRPALQRQLAMQMLETESLVTALDPKQRPATANEVADKLELFNEACKVFSRMRLIDEMDGSFLGPLGIFAYMPSYKRYDIRLLPSYANVFAAGEIMSHLIFDDNEIIDKSKNNPLWWNDFSGYANAHTSQDECLNCIEAYCLHEHNENNSKKLSRKNMRMEIDRMIQKFDYNKAPPVSIFVDDSVSFKLRNKIIDMCSLAEIQILKKSRKTRNLYVVDDMGAMVKRLGGDYWTAMEKTGCRQSARNSTKMISAKKLIEELETYCEFRSAEAEVR